LTGTTSASMSMPTTTTANGKHKAAIPSAIHAD
jgi:hypothetical protein